MSVTVRLHASVREAAGTSRLTLQASSVGALRLALAAACPQLADRLSACRFAVADEFVADDARIGEGAVVDVIPPVSGG